MGGKENERRHREEDAASVYGYTGTHEQTVRQEEATSVCGYTGTHEQTVRLRWCVKGRRALRGDPAMLMAAFSLRLALGRPSHILLATSSNAF